MPTVFNTLLHGQFKSQLYNCELVRTITLTMCLPRSFKNLSNMATLYNRPTVQHALNHSYIIANW